MRLLLAVPGIFMAIALAAPAHPDPGVDDPPAADTSAFLASLQRAGISYNDPDQAVTAAKAVCGLVGNGKPGLEVLQGLMSANPGFTTDGAAQFAAIAASVYCPHQLASDGGSAK